MTEALLLNKLHAQLAQARAAAQAQLEQGRAHARAQAAVVLHTLQARKRLKLVMVLRQRDQRLGAALGWGQRRVGQAQGGLARLERVWPMLPGRLRAAQPKLAASLGWSEQALCAALDALVRPRVQGYDELNVKQVAARLDGLGLYDLLRLRDYELTHKNRVTVLRELERRLQVLEPTLAAARD